MIFLKRFFLRKYLLLCCVLVTIPLLAQTDISSILSSPELAHSQYSFYAEECTSGKTLLNVNSDYSLAPASGLKIITTATALLTLGSDYRYHTTLGLRGALDRKGRLNGDLIITGSGDPTLGSGRTENCLTFDLLFDTWTQAIVKQNIKRIDGNLILDISRFEDQSTPDYWPWMDLGNYYGAGSNALCINENMYEIWFKPGNNPGDLATVLRTEPRNTGLTFINDMKTGEPGSGDNGYIYAAPRQREAVLRGTIPAGVDKFSIKGAITDAPRLIVSELVHHLNDIGISFNGKVIISRIAQTPDVIIFDIESAPLSEIIYWINHKSINLYTEQVLKTIAYNKKGFGSTANGIAIIDSILDQLQIEHSGLELFDGSGLSPVNMVTTKIFSQLLSAMSKQPVFQSYYQSFAVAGTDYNIGKNTILENNARIKTGYVTAVRSFSGYVTNSRGTLISYSMIVNNYHGKTSSIDQLFEKVLIKLAE